jgi:hypothetical protein
MIHPSLLSAGMAAALGTQSPIHPHLVQPYTFDQYAAHPVVRPPPFSAVSSESPSTVTSLSLPERDHPSLERPPHYSFGDPAVVTTNIRRVIRSPEWTAYNVRIYEALKHYPEFVQLLHAIQEFNTPSEFQDYLSAFQRYLHDKFSEGRGHMTTENYSAFVRKLLSDRRAEIKRVLSSVSKDLPPSLAQKVTELILERDHLLDHLGEPSTTPLRDFASDHPYASAAAAAYATSLATSLAVAGSVKLARKREEGKKGAERQDRINLRREKRAADEREKEEAQKADRRLNKTPGLFEKMEVPDPRQLQCEYKFAKDPNCEIKSDEIKSDEIKSDEIVDPFTLGPIEKDGVCVLGTCFEGGTAPAGAADTSDESALAMWLRRKPGVAPIYGKGAEWLTVDTLGV